MHSHGMHGCMFVKQGCRQRGALVCAGHSDGLETGAMSSDDSMVLTAAYDKSARVWDLASGKCLAVLASSAQVRPMPGTSVLQPPSFSQAACVFN